MLTTSINIVKKKFDIMAESNRGPLIALHQNACCCQFTINRKYRETVTILRNFIRQKVDDITFGNYKACSLQEALDQRRTTRNISNDLRVTNSYERKLLNREFGLKMKSDLNNK